MLYSPSSPAMRKAGYNSLESEKISNMRRIALEPIGYVRTSASDTDLRTRKRFVLSDIVLNKRFVQGLKGIEGYSHVCVIFWLHKVKKSATEELLLHPRRRDDLPKVGIFSTRQSNHPNPIGMTVVKLVTCKSGMLRVKGLDAMSGSPVIDIKPYDFQDIRRNIRVPDWWRKLHKQPESSNASARI